MLMWSINASLSETLSNLRSTALKCCLWLLLEAICVSSVEILAELNVDNVSAAADMPRATKSKNLSY
jgi:hypothetical protein